MRYLLSVFVICCVLFVSSVLCAAAASTEAEYQAEFTLWTHTHGKAYASHEFDGKYNTWKTNYANYQAHNAAGTRSFTQALNAYSDLTWEEFSTTYLGAKPLPAEPTPTPAPQSEKRAAHSCASGTAVCGTGCCSTASNYACVSGKCESCSTGNTICGSSCCPSSGGYVCTTAKQCISCGSGYTTCPTGECCPSTYTCSATGCTGAQVATGSPLAPTVNWTAHGVVSPVKNQGQCGSCWSFSATGALEAAYNIKHGLSGSTAVSLSEQNLLDCSSNSTYGNQGCNGGVVQYAFTYVKNQGGIDTESSYPLTAATTGAIGTCAYKVANKGASITGQANIATGSETALQTQLNTQPVSVAICAAPSLQGYASGVYDDPACGTGNIAINHAVLATGYGTDSSAGAYWIIKNSWGTTWGINGYFLLKKGTNQCGVAQQACYPISA